MRFIIEGYETERIEDFAREIRKRCDGRGLLDIEVVTRVINPNWSEYLSLDPEDGMCVKNTLVTVASILDLIYRGWTAEDILKTHPELEYNDITACLDYADFQENRDGHCKKVGRKSRRKANQVVGGTVGESSPV